jgi:hypothetical protein
VEELVLPDLGRLGVVAYEDDVDLLVVPREEQVQQDEERLARSLRAWSMDPDTSITQNITAWLMGAGTRVRLRKRRSSGSRKATVPMRSFRASMRCCSSATASLVPSSCASKASS